MTPLLTGLGLSAAAGLNAWAILLLFNGLFLLLPQEFPGPTAAILTSHFAVTAALVLFLLEFVADKIPVVDHLWNLLQTLLRPVVGALLTLAAVPETTRPERVGLALAGAAATLATHLVKSTTRLTSTAATRGMAQFALSLAEDALALALGALVFFVPSFTAILIFALVFLLVLDRRRVGRALGVLFFRLKHPRRLLRQS
ncbi:MAG TPA: DUF4126 domain-containing protein [Thermoanaerobaculia bacterium]|nr:DUF4126 domain-containing protein [Thermoanaerobaculia bacterium]